MCIPRNGYFSQVSLILQKDDGSQGLTWFCCSLHSLVHIPYSTTPRYVSFKYQCKPSHQKRSVGWWTQKSVNTKLLLRFRMSLGALLNGKPSYEILSGAIGLVPLSRCSRTGTVLTCSLWNEQMAGFICCCIEAFDSGCNASLYSVVRLLPCCFPGIPTVSLPWNNCLAFVSCPSIFIVCVIGI